MSPIRRIEAEQTRRFPRVSGDEPLVVSALSGWFKFSPRERG